MRPPDVNGVAPPDLSTAIQQELGLRLAPTNATLETFAIDRVQAPSEN